MFSQSKYVIAQASGIPSFVNWLNRNQLLVLTYHCIYDGSRRSDLLPGTFVHIDDMTKQLRYVKRKYHIIHPDEFLASIEFGSQLPQYAALITFDDGYESFYRLAAPLLDSLGIKSVVFISTKYVEEQLPFWFDLLWLYIIQSKPNELRWLEGILDLNCTNIQLSPDPALFLKKMKRILPEQRDKIMSNKEITKLVEHENHASMISLFYPMTDGQIKRLSDLGTIFGGHTHTHTILSAMPDSLAKSEVLINKKKLELLLGKPCVFFAYPNGGEGDFNEKHKELLRLVGYKAAFSLTQMRSLVHEDPMNISRIHVAPEDTLGSLAFRCTGINPIFDWFLDLPKLMHSNWNRNSPTAGL